jgi:hypothetical protein
VINQEECITRGADEKCIQGRLERKTPLRKPMLEWERIINIDFKVTGNEGGNHIHSE